MNAKERIENILLYYSINAKTLSERLEMDRPQAIYDILSGKTKSITEKMACKIISVFSEINKTWLLTGEGEMLKGRVAPPVDLGRDDHKAPLKRIIYLLSIEGFSLEEFAACINSKESLFNNALRWPINTSAFLLGNYKEILGWVDSFCEVFPHYSKLWILLGKGDKLTYVAKELEGIKERINALENQQEEEKKTLLRILDHFVKE